MIFHGLKFFVCTGLLVIALFPRHIQADYHDEHRSFNNFLSKLSSDINGLEAYPSARNLQEVFVEDCFQPSCEYTNSLGSDNLAYTVNTGSNTTLDFEFNTGTDRKELTLSLDVQSMTLTQTTIFLISSDMTNDGHIATIMGTSWARGLTIPTSTDPNRKLSIQIGVLSTSTPTSTITFRIIQTFNEPPPSNTVSTWSPSGGSSVWEVIVALVGGTIVLAFLIFCIHSLCTRRRYNRSRIGQMGRQAPEFEVVALPNPEEEARKLTEENLDERFPEAPFENFKSFFSQKTCSICLEELKSEQPCRQLYCEHIFHSECIKLWLVNQLKKNHAFCPNCNQNMMFEQQQGQTQILVVEPPGVQTQIHSARTHEVVNNSI